MLQLARYSTEGLLQLGPLGSTTFLPDTKCLVDDGRGRTPRLKKCETVSRTSQRLWDFTQVEGRCVCSSGSPLQYFRFTKCNKITQRRIQCWIHVHLSCFHVLLFQNGPIISRDTGRCLEVEMSKDANFGLRLVVQRCSGQKWMIRNWIKHPRH